jgi:phytoene dehydrogenase-like protein
MKNATPQAVVIGGGVESLVAATYLARGGLKTIVLEKRSELGGLRSPWPGRPEVPVALVHDDDASLHPEVARGLQLADGRLPCGPVAPTIAALTGEGRLVELSVDRNASVRSIAALSQPDAERYVAFRSTLERVAHAIRPLVLRAPPVGRPDASDVWTALLTGRRYLGLARREAFQVLRWPPMPVADLVDEWFASDPLKALVATRGLFGVFAGPRSAGTTAVLLLRAAADGGLVPDVRPIVGGSAALIDALAKRAQGAGVEIRPNTEVVRVIVERGVVVGTLLGDGTRLDATVAVSGVDPRRTFLDLLDPTVLPPDLTRRALNIRARGTLARAIFLLDSLPDSAWPNATAAAASTVHLVSTLEDLERAFDAMKYGAWRDPLWLEVRLHRPPGASTTDGRRAMSVTAHFVPRNLRGRRWADARAPLADAMLAAIDRYVPGVASRVVDWQVLTPEDLELEFGMTGGHPLHAELSLDQLWSARPALGLGGYRTPVPGLYLCGPGTHPGVGPQGTSGLLASRTVLRDGRSPPS